MTDFMNPNTIDITGTIDYVDDIDTDADIAAGNDGTPLFSADDVERINEKVRAEAAQNLATVYRTPKFEQREAEREQAAEQAARERAERIAAGGGGEVTTELRGVAGERVAEVLGLGDIASAASKLAHRINDEVDAIRAEQDRGRAERLGAALEDAWADAEGKRKVPDIVGPLAHWYEHERLAVHPDQWRGEALKRIDEQHAERNRARVEERLDDIDPVLRDVAADILEAAGRAADALAGAGLSIDATSEEVAEKALEVGDTGILSARKTWRDAVARWADLQSARRWVEVARTTGFDPRRPAEIGNFDPRPAVQREMVPREPREARDARRERLADLERAVWGEQFDAVGLPVGIDSPASALSWWNEHGRPAGNGVGLNDVETGAQA